MVADEARKLAKYYKIDEDKAYITGLTHDIAKEFSDEENKRIILDNGLPKELLDDKYKKIIHADIGAIYVKDKYNFDNEMCDAIKYHTIGHYPMSLLAKIIMVADKIARKDDNPNIERERKLAYEDIDKAIYDILLVQRDKLNSLGLDIHPETKKLFEYLESLYN